MANKRIKISELPKITYSRLAGSTSVTHEDYIPIAVTDPDNKAVKTTQTITTKQLQRFVLQQGTHTDEDSEWDPNTLYIGAQHGSSSASPFEVKVPGNLEIGGSLTVDTLQPRSIVGVTSFDVSGQISSNIVDSNYVYANKYFVAGGASGTTYPATVTTAFTLLCSDASGGPLNQTPFKTLIANAPVSTFTDRVVTIDTNSKFNFNQTYESFFAKSGLFNAADLNKILYVGSGYGFGKGDITYQQLNSTVTSLSTIFPPSTQDGSAFKCTDDTTSLLDTPTDVGEDDLTRSVFNSPVVLGAKHPDGEDLTEREVSYKYAAQMGEMRWNVFNEVPTLYLAVKPDPDQGKTSVTIKRKDGVSTISVAKVHTHAMIWYGVPLFGTLHELSGGALSGQYQDIDA